MRQRSALSTFNGLWHPVYLRSITPGNAHAGNRVRFTSMGWWYDAATPTWARIACQKQGSTWKERQAIIKTCRDSTHDAMWDYILAYIRNNHGRMV